MKYKVGDIVTVIKLDEKVCEELYDNIGQDYKELHFKSGEIVELDIGNRYKHQYIVSFAIISHNEWYFSEDEIMLKEEFEKRDLKVMKALYGRTKV